MEYSPKESMTQRRAIQIIVPILIVIAIGAIWFFKNSDSPGGSGKKVDFALHVTEQIDIEKLKSYGVPIIIDFGADSCIPCKEMAPVLVKLNQKLQGKAIIKFVDVWKYKQLAAGYPIRVIPTQIFIDKNGKPYVPSDPQGAKMRLLTSKDNNEHVFTIHVGGMTESMLLTALKEMGMKE